jgi:hypothetical protein
MGLLATWWKRWLKWQRQSSMSLRWTLIAAGGMLSKTLPYPAWQTITWLLMRRSSRPELCRQTAAQLPPVYLYQTSSNSKLIGAGITSQLQL